jgi:histidine triad (HIT) family protein
VYEDDSTIAFLDIYPAVEGQVVVTTKNQVEFVWDLPEPDYQALMATVKKVSLRLREVLGTKYVGTRIEGVDVAHAHVKLYPFTTVEEYNRPQDMTKKPDHTKLAELANKLQLEAN